jgi:hypothetical protein|nr:MAG TPA: hypothetical protein [Caudoviricetes sp.]
MKNGKYNETFCYKLIPKGGKIKMAKMEVVKKRAMDLDVANAGKQYQQSLVKGTSSNGETNSTSIKTNVLILNKGGQKKTIYGDFQSKLKIMGILDEEPEGRMSAFRKLNAQNFVSQRENSWNDVVLKNRYVQESLKVAEEKENKRYLDTVFTNIDGMTNKAIKNSVIGTVIGGVNTKVMADRMLAGFRVKGLNSVDKMNDMIFEPLSKIDWSKKFVFGADERERLYDMFNLQQFTPFGSTPRMIDDLIRGKATMQSLAEDYVNAIGAENMPSPSFEAYCADLLSDYQNNSLDIRRMAAMYYYIKANKNSMAVNSLDNLGKLSGDFVDGMGDLLNRGIDRIADDIQTTAYNIYDNVSEYASTFGVMLNPDLRKNMDKFFDKMGFNTIGKGRDAVSYVSNSIKHYVLVEIDKQKFSYAAFKHYWELHDYVDTNSPTRIITMRFTMAEAHQLNLDKGIHDINIQRRYGYPYTQNAYRFHLDGGAYFKYYDEIVNFKAKSKIVGGLPTQKEIDAAVASNSGAETQYIEVEFTVIPSELYADESGKTFNEIPKDAKISSIISAAFNQCYQGGSLVLTPPKNDLTLDNYPITPQTFPQLLNTLHENFRIYDGGPNMFVDRGIFYVINRDGPNDLKLEDIDWLYKFDIKPKNTLYDVMQTTIVASEKTVSISLYDADIIFPNDYSESDPVISRWNKGSILGTRQSVSNQTMALNTKVEEVNHDYLLKEEEVNQPSKDFILRIPNSFLTLVPSDDIEVSYQKKTYIGTIKKWASEMEGNTRIILLYCTSREGKSKAYDNTPLGKLKSSIDRGKGKLNAKIQQAIGKVKDKYIPEANNEMQKLQDVRAKTFGDAVREAQSKGVEIKSLEDANKQGLFKQIEGGSVFHESTKEAVNPFGWGKGSSGSHNHSGFSGMGSLSRGYSITR